MSVAHAIEEAVAAGSYEGSTLVVFDALDRPGGMRLEVEPASCDSGGWVATARDHGVYAMMAHAHDRESAVIRALDGYLDLVNRV